MTTSYDSEALLSHAGWVRLLARALVRDAHEADDLAQETLVRAWQRGPREPGAWRAWLRSVLHNTLAEKRRESGRRAARERDAARAEGLPSVLDSAERFSTHRRVVAEVEALDEPYRTTVLLRYFEELPPREIARRLGVPVRTVQSRLERAHARLRERLEREHGGDRERALAALLGLAGEESASGRVGPTSTLAAGAVLAACALVALALWQPWAAHGPARTSALAHAQEDDTAREPAVSSAPAEGGARAPASAGERGVVAGRVLDRAGNAIAGARVELRERAARGLSLRAGEFARQEHVIGTATSGADGAWRVEVLVDTPVDAEVHASGFALERVANVLAGDDVELRLERAAELVIDVRGAQGGAPRAGAQIDLRRAGSDAIVCTGETRADGTWSSSELAPGPWSALVRDAGSGRAAQARIDATLRAGARVETRCELGDGLALTGIVRGVDGKPIEHAAVSIDPDGRTCAESGPDGRFQIRGLSTGGGSFSVRASVSGLACDVDLARAQAGEVPEVTLELRPGVRLAGRVVDGEGAPCAGAWVVAWSRRNGVDVWDERDTRCDSGGAFELADLRSDLDYVLLVRSSGRGDSVQLVKHEAHAARRELAPIVLEHGARVEGRVQRADGSALAGAEVLVERLDALATNAPLPAAEAVVSTEVTRGERSTGASAATAGTAGPGGPLDVAVLTTRRTRARADGTFRVLDLAAGRYRVSALTPAARVVERREVELVAGATLRDVALTLRGSGRLAGTVLDPERRALTGAWVLLYVEGERIECRSAPVDDEGRFQFEGLEAERYMVSASVFVGLSNGRADRPFARADAHDVETGRTDVEVVLQRTRRIEGRALDEHARPLAGVLVNALSGKEDLDQAHSDSNGRFVLQVAESAWVYVEGSWSAQDSTRELFGRAAGIDAAHGDVELILK